jgi:hypothetical protein
VYEILSPQNATGSTKENQKIFQSWIIGISPNIQAGVLPNINPLLYWHVSWVDIIDTLTTEMTRQ